MLQNNSESHSDVSSEVISPISETSIDGAGMDSIAVPINIDLGNLGFQTQFGKAKATVNTVDGKIKGIHMSRLYLGISETLESNTFSIDTIEKVLGLFKDSHKGISDSANLKISLDWPLKRPALKSSYSGWRTYPVEISSSLDKSGKISHRVEISISYGSFCPCSASLAREVIQQKFAQDFENMASLSKDEIVAWLGKESSIAAIPHGQRSTAKISFNLKRKENFDVPKLIEFLESTIKTPVQTAVKRVDEKEFARICASNLMFVEDAVKIFYRGLNQLDQFDKIKVEVSHHESLHAHDAIAVIDESQIH